jgi:hypothetical protein
MESPLNQFIGALFFGAALALIPPVAASTGSVATSSTNALPSATPEQKTILALPSPEDSLPDALYTYWLTEYEGGLSYSDLEDALQVAVPRKERQTLDQLKKKLAGLKLDSREMDILCRIRIDVPSRLALHVAAIELTSSPRTPDLCVSFLFRGGARVSREHPWHEPFTDKKEVRILLDQARNLLVKHMAAKGILV